MTSSGTFYVYEHWRPDLDLCFYVGKGRHQRAWKMGERNAHHRSIQSKLTALGLAVDVRIVINCVAEDTAFMVERDRIAMYPREQLANMTKGGEGVAGLIMSIASRVRMSKAKQGVKRGAYSAEHRKKIGEGQKGKILSTEHREKLRVARARRVVSDETREKMRQTMLAKSKEWHLATAAKRKGHVVTLKTRAKISAKAQARHLAKGAA